MKMFRLLQIVVHYQKSLIIHQKILCFRKLSLDLEIVHVNITSLITIHCCIMTLRKIVLLLHEERIKIDTREKQRTSIHIAQI